MQSYDPWRVPENPFNYRGLVSHPQGLGNIPRARFGEKIAIIGAGCSGLGAAFELMKIGLHPVVYEADSRLGGRAFTFQFPGDPRALAEIGAMRIPPTHRTLTYYLDTFSIDYSQPFPDPLVVPTTLYFEGKKHFIPVGGELPPDIRRAKDKWQAVINPLVDKMARVWRDPEGRNRQWQEFVKTYADKSFFEVLRENGLSPAEIKLFGMLGLGTGGFDSLYRISFLEILRLKVCKWDDDQRLIKGGCGRLPLSFWSVPRHCVHWGLVSVQMLNNRRPRPAVQEIHTPPEPSEKVSIVDIHGNTEQYAAVIVTCSPRALEMDIAINRETFSDDVWMAIKNIHLIASGKVFVRTRTAFWKEPPLESTLTCTITDEATRATYLFDFDDTASGVICLSYTWEDSAVKFNALSHEDRVRLCLRLLAKIYGRDLISPHVVESVSFFWEEMKGYNGGFKLTYPGQYEHQRVLFKQPFEPGPELHNGVFLAGETTSWAGGWLEGALHSGLDASRAIVSRLGGNLNLPPSDL